jgi:hypothetical protein
MGVDQGAKAVLFTALAIGAAILALIWTRANLPVRERGAVATVPIVMHTQGGRLEVATVKARESFNLADPKRFFGLDMGTTVSELRADVTYRFYIDMAKEWAILISADGKTATVHAGLLKPSLPVAFDTAGMAKYTTSGWARFNKQENLANLEASLSAQLQQRANGYRELARESGRVTVRDFVTTWLIKEGHWSHGGEHRVAVRFPDDSPEDGASVQ